MTSILEQIENTFVEELCKLNIENLERLRTQPYDDAILDIFKNTYDILINKTNDELNNILDTLENMNDSATISTRETIVENGDDDTILQIKNSATDKVKKTTESTHEIITKRSDDDTDTTPQIKNTAIEKVNTTTDINEPNIDMDNIKSIIIQIAINAVKSQIDKNKLIIHNEDMKKNSVPAENIGGTIYKNFFTKNKGYTVYNPKGDGDCFFYVAQEALHGIGIIKTVAELRNIVAENIDKEMFGVIKVANYNGKIPIEMTDFDKKIADIDTSIEENIRNSTNIFSKANNLTTLNETKKSLEVEQLNKFKEYIKTNEFWADDIAIGILEKNLNVIFIQFNENADAKQNIFLIYCRGINIPENAKYIFTSFTGNHFKLITYNEKKIFTKDELPQEIKDQYKTDCRNEL